MSYSTSTFSALLGAWARPAAPPRISATTSAAIRRAVMVTSRQARGGPVPALRGQRYHDGADLITGPDRALKDRAGRDHAAHSARWKPCGVAARGGRSRGAAAFRGLGTLWPLEYDRRTASTRSAMAQLSASPG